jgi:DNA-binding CsgD family transcriptional regulator
MMVGFPANIVLDAISAPVLILDPERRVIYNNSAALELFDGRFGLTLRAGMLHFKDITLDGLYQTAVNHVVAQAKAKEQETTFVPLLADTQGRRAVLHLALAGSSEDGDAAKGKQSIIAIMGCTRVLDAVQQERLCKAFNFSAAEGEVAALLVSGQTPREIAKARNTSEQTVRWHIKNIHSKTHTRRLPDLLLQIQAARSPF